MLVIFANQNKEWRGSWEKNKPFIKLVDYCQLRHNRRSGDPVPTQKVENRDSISCYIVGMGDSNLRDLAIEFDRKNGIYKPGELVSCRILVHLAQSKQIRGLQVAIIGESVVQWSSKRNNPAMARSETDDHQLTPFKMMTNREEYFSSKFFLLGNESSPPFVLPAGQFAYPFKYQLPFDLPCSFEHEYGYIRYTIKAGFDKPSTLNDEVMTAFTVISTYDLNRKPEATLSIREEMIKNFFCSCLCPTGKIYARLSIPAIGFVPGQMIPVTVLCENESTVDVKEIKVSLQRKLKFHAKSPRMTTKSDESTVAEDNRVTPFTNNSEETITIQLKVPPLPPTGLEHCGLIDVDYVLRFVMCFSGMHFSVKRRFPILIGTVPLRFSIKTYKPIEGLLPSGVIPHPSHWDPNNLARSSNDASIYGVKTIRDENDSVCSRSSFTPQYSVYDYSPAYI